MCKITVAMTVKNGEEFLAECMNSVLDQTFSDFEFLIIDDHSSDKTLEILKSYQDCRIKILEDAAGYIGNLNIGINQAKGKYIARMDHDDIMHPMKLQTQLEVMEQGNLDLCASWVYIFGENIPEPYVESSEKGLVTDPFKILKHTNYIHHATTMIRKEFLINNDLQYQDYFLAEDYKLWFEIFKKQGIFYMVPEPLLAYRYSAHQIGTLYANDPRSQMETVKNEIRDWLQFNALK